MIKSIGQAVTIQSKRVATGKRGYSKAVRRFLKRTSTSYRGAISALPVGWPEKIHAPAPSPRGRAA